MLMLIIVSFLIINISGIQGYMKYTTKYSDLENGIQFNSLNL